MLLHQTSKTSEIGELGNKNKNLFIKHNNENNNENTYKLWTDEDLKKLLYEHKEFEKFRKYWDKLEGIQRSDIGRYMFLYIHGGLYADTDVTFNKSIKEYKSDKNLLFAFSNAIIIPNNHKSTNYVIYSKIKKHPFFLDLFKEIDKRIRDNNSPILVKKVPYATGADVITDVLNTSKNTNDVGTFPKEYIEDIMCSYTKLSPKNIAYHASSTSRNADDSWINKKELELFNFECKLREYFKASGNFIQFPILSIILILMIIVIILAMLFVIIKNY